VLTLCSLSGCCGLGILSGLCGGVTGCIAAMNVGYCAGCVLCFPCMFPICENMWCCGPMAACMGGCEQLFAGGTCCGICNAVCGGCMGALGACPTVVCGGPIGVICCSGPIALVDSATGLCTGVTGLCPGGISGGAAM
jgi:hypothetical protein